MAARMRSMCLLGWDEHGFAMLIQSWLPMLIKNLLLSPSLSNRVRWSPVGCFYVHILWVCLVAEHGCAFAESFVCMFQCRNLRKDCCLLGISICRAAGNFVFYVVLLTCALD